MKKSRNCSTVTAAISSRSIGRQRWSFGRITPPSSRPARAEAEEKWRSKLSTAAPRKRASRAASQRGWVSLAVSRRSWSGRSAALVWPASTKASSSTAKARPIRRPVSSRSIASRSSPARPDGATSPASQASDGRSGAMPARPRAEAQPDLNRAALELGPLEGQGRAVGEADDGDVHVLDPPARDLAARPARAAAGRRSSPAGRPRASPAPPPAPPPALRPAPPSPPSTAPGEISIIRGPDPVNMRPHRRADPRRRHRRRVGLEIVEHGLRGRHHRAIVDRADQLLGADSATGRSARPGPRR